VRERLQDIPRTLANRWSGLGGPGVVFGNANFGVIAAQANTPRRLQMALRLDF
jgi:hypothetical protein